MLGSRRFKLLGILYSGPVHSVDGNIEVVDIPTTQHFIAVTGIPTNLGNVIKSRKMKELGDVLWELAKSELG